MLLSLEVLMNSIYYFNILIGDVKSYYKSLEVGQNITNIKRLAIMVRVMYYWSDKAIYTINKF